MHEKWIKIGFWVFAATAVFFGVVSINQKINIKVAEGPAKADAGTDAFDQARLQVLDTDQDGLNDWEELNVHATSPYLADSDSDGASDRDEISEGSDPNCPKGRVCGSGIIGALEAIQEDIAQEDPADSAGKAEGEAPPAEFSEQSQQALDALETGSTPSAEQIRALLRDAGVPEEELSGASDEDLVQLFQEVASEQAEAQ